MTADVAEIYIADVEAQATAEAPCIVGDDFPHKQAAKAILRQAVLRWYRAGDGGVSAQQDTAGMFSRSVTFDSRRYGEGRLTDSEVRRLRALCRSGVAAPGRRAFTVAPR